MPSDCEQATHEARTHARERTHRKSNATYFRRNATFQRYAVRYSQLRVTIATVFSHRENSRRRRDVTVMAIADRYPKSSVSLNIRRAGLSTTFPRSPRRPRRSIPIFRDARRTRKHRERDNEAGRGVVPTERDAARRCEHARTIASRKSFIARRSAIPHASRTLPAHSLARETHSRTGKDTRLARAQRLATRAREGRRCARRDKRQMRGDARVRNRK